MSIPLNRFDQFSTSLTQDSDGHCLATVLLRVRTIPSQTLILSIVFCWCDRGYLEPGGGCSGGVCDVADAHQSFCREEQVCLTSSSMHKAVSP